jgi:hypothetical protein
VVGDAAIAASRYSGGYRRLGAMPTSGPEIRADVGLPDSHLPSGSRVPGKAEMRISGQETGYSGHFGATGSLAA